jgi:hypothetical protein
MLRGNGVKLAQVQHAVFHDKPAVVAIWEPPSGEERWFRQEPPTESAEPPRIGRVALGFLIALGLASALVVGLLLGPHISN